MLDALVRQGSDPAAHAELLREVRAHVARVEASAGRGDAKQVREAEDDVIAGRGTFTFDGDGRAVLTAAGMTWCAGRFETVSVATLRQRALDHKTAGAAGRARLWVLLGRSPATDIGALQATAHDGTLFQVASQFNCLESPGPYVTRVSSYFDDPTQGPRASVSAFPATLLRHYRAPGEGGSRFVQETDKKQINLLADAFGPGVAGVRNGYLTADAVADPQALVRALEANFELIRVGVHDAAQVVLGYDWDGEVPDSASRRIAQVFTSTVAGGGYGGARLGAAFEPACGHLLRAAYLGTLLAAAALGQRRVVLTLIGGGVFGNPMRLIWETILRAVDEVGPFLAGDLDVVVNGYNLAGQVGRDEIVTAVRARGGAVLAFGGPAGPAVEC